MNYTEYTDQHNDPYAVTGQERLKRFVQQFEREASLGPEGVLNQCCVLRQAKRHLTPHLYRKFCGELRISPEEAEKFYEVAITYRYFTGCLGPEFVGTLLLYACSMMDDATFCDVLNWGFMWGKMTGDEVRKDLAGFLIAPQLYPERDKYGESAAPEQVRH